MMLFNRTWLVIVMLLSIVALPIRVSAASPIVIFSEIAWAGSSISSSDEWIELTNLTAETIDLSLWTITGAGSSDKTLTLPEGSTIAPYSTYLIANYENGNTNTALATVASYVTAALSLPNDGFGLTLFDALGSQIDVAGGSGSPFAGGSGSTSTSSDGRYRSMVRVDGLIAGSDESAWSDATTSSEFLEGVQDLGTPGTVEQVTDGVDQGLSLGETEEADVEVTEEAEATVEKETTPTADEVTEEDAPVSSDPSVSSDTEVTEGVVEEEVVEEVAEEVVEVAEDEVTTIVEEANEEETEESTIETLVEVVEVVIEPEAVEEPKTEIIIVTQTVIHYTPGVILINEFVVDPLDGENEWIELVNRSAVTIALTGWTIEDASGKTTDLSSLAMTAGSTVVVDSPKGKLNNDEDTIILRDPTGQEIDSVSYGVDDLPSPKDGESLARTGDIFVIVQTPTKGGTNQIVAQETVVVEEVMIVSAESVSDETIVVESTMPTPQQQETSIPLSTKKTTTAKPTSSVTKKTGSKAVLSSTIAESKNLQDGIRVRLEGVVTALPGSFARQTFYLMDETAGIQVYFYYAEFPLVNLGDTIRVTGEMSTSHGERRVKMDSQTDLVVSKNDMVVTPIPLSISEVGESQVGSLITINGLVQTRESGKLVIEDRGSELTVSLKSDPEIDAEQFERGDRVTVTGILVSYDGELKIRPRTDEDINVDEPAAALALNTQDTGRDMLESSQAQTGIVLLVVTTAALGLLALRRNQNRRRLTLATP